MASINDPGFPGGRVPVYYTGDVNYTDSTARTLFTIPANSIIVGGQIIGHVASASNALGATLSVGILPSAGGAGTEYLNAYSIGPSQGSNYQSNVPWTNFGAQNSNYGGYTSFSFGSNAIPVSGKVAGSPLGGSGPWTVVFAVLDV